MEANQTKEVTFNKMTMHGAAKRLHEVSFNNYSPRAGKKL
jgi:hypothetical protein